MEPKTRARKAPAAMPNAPGPAEPPSALEDDRAGRDPGDLSSALSPRQIIGGFALLAGLILVLRRSRRKKG